MRRSINRRAILHHHRRVRWFSTVDLVNAFELEKAAAKQGQIAHRAYKGLGDLEYPFHDPTITVTRCGRICVGRRKINLSAVFAAQHVGIKEGSEKIWLVSFMHYDLGFFDHEAGRVECAESPFDAKALPMSSAPCVRVVVAYFYHRPRGVFGTRGRHNEAFLPSVLALGDKLIFGLELP